MSKRIRKLCNDETIWVTQHFAQRIRQRGIAYEDVLAAVMQGEIIEQYPDDYPYPSCLMADARPLHVVCSVGNGMLWFITAYIPDAAAWEPDWKTRKEKKP